MGLYSAGMGVGVRGGGLYSGGKRLQFAICQPYFSFFYQYRAHISTFFTSCKMLIFSNPTIKTLEYVKLMKEVKIMIPFTSFWSLFS